MRPTILVNVMEALVWMDSLDDNPLICAELLRN
jgi:hypothetical protein